MANPDPITPVTRNPAGPLVILAALGTGSLLTLMLLSNSTMAAHTSALYSSFAAHGVGSVVAAFALLALWRLRGTQRDRTVLRRHAPLWAYLGGISGALTVVATSLAANSELALTGTLALGIAGQMALALIFDATGAMGIERRLPSGRQLLSLAAIVVGTLLIIFSRGMS